ncbi:7,8-dihydropterin-6-yl-methyl-4-(beta-D-ribofuranosyl)aminobenzene 5'-phosphate synthase [Caldicellulosiruptor bescii]|uniref:Beta-lactamase domain protein n=2 Tax=Caldicellulosiruptor bescii TaxID=31899 RepID=B9MNU7_CALBD|nr:MBL fold metallo-hydrolase [Caldicellulosiruptor bescii]ACM59626.1 beta-lactamase domain protein [Caldicellulosiruptor bescii DSM 6725]PBC89650.1 7,8-dihydropterin-6-yl-methyl-4-(beta-D-ribofuranosyl)aminobenzene 5'-phosphate synthase [Caldicellulosiruptor bescii]PBC89973.1 7,8-dihydropterin-6-yl-methyl-4-(beta-D-ribofuranosyl)aminobenzene 5'-phosphate synthase [Caldicellulosiruptor bescii]PBD04596.1 7,8-dihydropterin-6-yl-methyl-4-(beta-D-ribofuranosyl)aminobenzene 5'-phosphate synthase [Ca
MRAKIIVNNWTFKGGYLAEHGLSILVIKDDKKILFDCGQTNAIVKNIEKMGVGFDFDAIVLSHAHYDHIGGLKFLIERTDCNIWVHHGFFEKKFAKREGEYKFIGENFEVLDMARFKVVNEDVYEMFDGIFVVNVTSGKESDEFYILKDGRFQSDLFLEEQSLVVKEDNKLILIVGCSHNGIENIIEKVEKCFSQSIFAVIGGFHSKDFQQDDLQRLCQFFKNKRIYKLVPLHCSGTEALIYFGNNLPNKLKVCGVGDVIEISS